MKLSLFWTDLLDFVRRRKWLVVSVSAVVLLAVLVVSRPSWERHRDVLCGVAETNKLVKKVVKERGYGSWRASIVKAGADVHLWMAKNGADMGVTLGMLHYHNYWLFSTVRKSPGDRMASVGICGMVFVVDK